MGIFIDKVKIETEKIEIISATSFKNCIIIYNNKVSLSKLGEFYANYKMICETFSINFTEFEQIFGNIQNEFVLWDHDNNGLIDSLELFTGISLFADSSTNEKLKCILYYIISYSHFQYF